MPSSESIATPGKQLDDLASQLGDCVDEVDTFASEHLKEIDVLAQRLTAGTECTHPEQDDPVVASVLEQFEALREINDK